VEQTSAEYSSCKAQMLVSRKFRSVGRTFDIFSLLSSISASDNDHNKVHNAKIIRTSIIIIIISSIIVIPACVSWGMFFTINPDSLFV
jgi:hypothetical protein